MFDDWLISPIRKKGLDKKDKILIKNKNKKSKLVELAIEVLIPQLRISPNFLVYLGQSPFRL